MNKVTFALVVLCAFGLGCSLPTFFNDNSMLKDIEVEAAFVDGVRIQQLDDLLRSKLTVVAGRTSADVMKDDIYLVVRCAPRGTPKKRILSLKVRITKPEALAGVELELFQEGFLTSGASYSVHKVLSVDKILPPGTREDILKSELSFDIVELAAK